MGYVDLSTLHTPIGGARPPAAYGRQIEANFDFLANPPKCRVYNDADISIAVSGTPQALAFNSERWDTDSMHDTITNNDRITTTTPGIYTFGAAVEFEVNATGFRQVYFERFNSAGVSQGTYANDVRMAVTAATVSTDIVIGGVDIDMSAGDYVKVFVNQTSGAALNVKARTKYSPEVWAIWQSL